jgi:spermidine/putrescine transport system substrate-binding protein
MWGTTGILYNAKYVTPEEAASWDVIRNPKFAGKIFIKDSARDVYSQIILKLRQNDIQEGKVSADDLMYYTSDEALEEFERYMADVRPLVAGWEADFGKDQMTQERGWISLNWSGDSVWAIEEAEEMGVDLRYVCPKEGFTVWFDGWVIPKYAKNVKAASWWINFLNRPDIVVRNVEANGYVSCNAAPEVLEGLVDDSYDPVDLTYFFGEGADSIRVNPVLYPDAADIARSCMEHDWGANTDKLISTWARIKGDNANSMTYIVICVVVLAILVAAIAVARKGRNRKKSHKRR